MTLLLFAVLVKAFASPLPSCPISTDPSGSYKFRKTGKTQGESLLINDTEGEKRFWEANLKPGGGFALKEAFAQKV